MYDNLSSRLRGEAEVSDASPYIKKLMKEAADALDHFEKAFLNLSKPFDSEEGGEENGWHEFEPGKYIYDEMEANP